MFVDIIVLIVTIGSALIAFLRGFIREVLTIFGIAGGIAAAYIGGPVLAPFMKGWIGAEEKTENLFGVLPYPLLANILSYGAILILFVILLSILSHFLAEFAKNMGLGALDRTLGVVFGIVRAAFVLGLLYLPFFYLAGDNQKEEWFKSSKTQPYLEITSSWIDGFIPKDAAQEVQDSVEGGIKDIETMSKTRQKLQEMDILKKNDKDAEPKKSEGEPSKDGYSQDFREGMDKIIEKNIDLKPRYNN